MRALSGSSLDAIVTSTFFRFTFSMSFDSSIVSGPAMYAEAPAVGLSVKMSSNVRSACLSNCARPFTLNVAAPNWRSYDPSVLNSATYVSSGVNN